MWCLSALIISLLAVAQADLRASTRRYKPIIQVTEEININDITFTTSAPEFDRSSSQKMINYYPKHEGKGGYSRLSDTSPSVFPHLNYGSGQQLIKYKPYKLVKVQDGFRPTPYKPKIQEKTKLLTFDPTVAYSSPETTKQYLTKIVPFSSQPPSKPPTRPTNFFVQDSKSFIPSPTFSPTVLAQINNEKHNEAFTTQKSLDWPKPTKKPYHIKKSKKISENHQSGGDEFVESSQENHSPSTSYREPQQESESFLSEISTLHKGGTSGNDLEGVADLKTGERVEFQMYGMDGPQSYKFGFDTGKGQNRHFRFEERDNSGKVKGHYGYLDEDGKMRIMKYEADPITGFHAGPVEISPDDN